MDELERQIRWELEDARKAARWLCERLEDAQYFAGFVRLRWPWLEKSIQNAIEGRSEEK